MSENHTPEAPQGPEFALQRIYVKDISFESPNAPAVFMNEWTPESNMTLNTKVNPMGEGHYEVILQVGVTTKVGERVAYMVEVQQAGVFLARGMSEEELGRTMGAYCPGLLFPFVREVVSDLVSKGSFPQLLLTPVNFEALYYQHLQQRQSVDEATTH
jgi:preprotein translocase subunit SecB